MHQPTGILRTFNQDGAQIAVVLGDSTKFKHCVPYSFKKVTKFKVKKQWMCLTLLPCLNFQSHNMHCPKYSILDTNALTQ